MPASQPRRSATAPCRWRSAVGFLVAVVLAVRSAGAVEPLPPPEISPYRLVVTKAEDGALAATGFLPDEAAIEALAARLGDGARLGLVPASGAPSPRFAEDVAAMVEAVAPLADWRLALRDREVRLRGTAGAPSARDRVRGDLDRVLAARGYALARFDVRAGEPRLTPTIVEAVVGEAAACGPLRIEAPPEGHWPPGARIVVSGRAAGPRAAVEAERRLAALAGDRPTALDLDALSAPVCAVMGRLPREATPGFSIWLGRGPGGTPVSDGLYRPGEVPVIDVVLPREAEGFLHVALVDVTGVAVNLLPTADFPVQAVERLGRIEGDRRLVRVAFTRAEASVVPARIVLEIDPTPGRTLVLALVTARPLFETPRPLVEPAEEFAEALARMLAERDPARLGLATAFIAPQ